MIVTDSRHPADRDVLDAWSRRERVTVVDTYDAVFDELRRGGAARAYVMDVDGWPPGGARELSRALRIAEAEALVILRTDLTRRALMELPHLAHSESLRRLRLSFRGHEALDAHLESESDDDPACATFEILRETIGFIPPREQHVWVATVVMGRRKGRRAAVQGRVGMGKDKLRETYNRWGLPPFPDVHAEILGAHLLAAVEAGASVDARRGRASRTRQPRTTTSSGISNARLRSWPGNAPWPSRSNALQSGSVMADGGQVRLSPPILSELPPILCRLPPKLDSV